MAVKTKQKPKKSKMAQWVESAAKHARMKYAEIGRQLGYDDRSIVQKMATGNRKVTADELLAIAEITKFSLPEWPEDIIPRNATDVAIKLSTAPRSLEETDPPSNNSHDQSNPHMPFWDKGDGYRIDDPGQSPDEDLRKFLAPYITGGVDHKYEIWFLISDVIQKGDCKAGSYLVVELGREPKPQDVVLAMCTNKKLPIFRYWVGRNLVPAPLIPSKLPILVEGCDAAVLGVVIDRYPPGAT